MKYSILISSCVDENDSILENQNQVELNGEKFVSFLKQY